MPFVTVNGSAKLNWDLRYDRYDPKTGDMEQKGNGLKQLDLTEGEKFDFQPNGEKAKEVLWRGQPNPIDMNWNEMPVFRVLTHRFISGEKRPGDLDTDWGRFMRDYERQKKDGTFIFYEPDIDDIRIDPDNNYAFPLWVIEHLEEAGEFDQALKLNKVNLPKVPRLQKTEYDRIIKEIEIRKEASKPKEKETIGNVSGHSKQSKS